MKLNEILERLSSNTLLNVYLGKYLAYTARLHVIEDILIEEYGNRECANISVDSKIGALILRLADVEGAMTIEEFFGSNEKLAIHCSTQEQAIILSQAFDSKHFYLSPYVPYKDQAKKSWTLYGSRLAFTNRASRCNVDYLMRDGWTILSFDSIKLK